MEMLSKELFEYVLAVASGKKVKAEEAGFPRYGNLQAGCNAVIQY